MSSPALTIETAPRPADVAFLEDQINEFNVATTQIDDGVLLAIFVRDDAGAVVAGIYGWTWGGCCEVRYLWVHAARRGQGYGSRLLRAAEDEARARGCAQIVLDTHSFQAPVFYQRRGFTIVGVIDGYPRGHAKYVLRKDLRAAT